MEYFAYQISDSFIEPFFTNEETLNHFSLTEIRYFKSIKCLASVRGPLTLSFAENEKNIKIA